MTPADWQVILKMVRRLVHALPTGTVDQDDLLQDAMLGWAQARARFEPGRNVLFHTFSLPRIWGSMIDGVRAQSPLSRRGYEALLRSFDPKFHPVRSDWPTNDPDVTHWKLSDRADSMQPDRASVAAHIPGYGADVTEALHSGSTSSPEHEVIMYDTIAHLRAAIDRLEASDRALISQLYGLRSSPLSTGDQIARQRGVSASYVSRRRRTVLKELARTLSSDDAA